MIRQLAWSGLATFLAAYIFYSATAGEKVRVTVEGAIMQFEPASVRLRIRVEPDAENRALTVAVLSEGYERSSLEQLDGADAPISRWITYKGIPAGDYEAVAVVYRPNADNWRAAAVFKVLGRH